VKVKGQRLKGKGKRKNRPGGSGKRQAQGTRRPAQGKAKLEDGFILTFPPSQLRIFSLLLSTFSLPFSDFRIPTSAFTKSVICPKPNPDKPEKFLKCLKLWGRFRLRLRIRPDRSLRLYKKV
jgi:hypothetical protein